MGGPPPMEVLLRALSLSNRNRRPQLRRLRLHHQRVRDRESLRYLSMHCRRTWQLWLTQSYGTAWPPHIARRGLSIRARHYRGWKCSLLSLSLTYLPMPFLFLFCFDGVLFKTFAQWLRATTGFARHPKTFPATATRTGSAANSIKRFAGRSRTTCSLRWDCRIGPRSSRTDTNQFPLIQPWRLQSKHWDLAERGRGNSNNNKINNQRNTNWKRTDDCRLLCRSIRRPGAGGGSEVAVVYYLRGETMAHRL